VEEQYANHLDWFAVDLEGEQSAMDGRILEEHGKHVVQVVQWILSAHLCVPHAAESVQIFSAFVHMLPSSNKYGTVGLFVLFKSIRLPL